MAPSKRKNTMSYQLPTQRTFAVTVTLLVTAYSEAQAMDIAEWLSEDLEVREYQVEHAVEHRGLLSAQDRNNST
jgi:hypothetical protein